jgi:hypothetical protein
MRRCLSLILMAGLVGCQRSEVRSAPEPAAVESPYPEERARGAAEARALIAGGTHALLVPSAVPIAWMHAIRVEEHGRFGVEYRLTGDSFSPSFEAYRAGFNEAMARAVKARFGEDVFDRIDREIERRLREEAPAPP